jgi:hypothetical protein
VTEVKQGAEVVCARCGRGIDSCAVCASEACHECICYLCLVVALGHSKPHPHEHGG